MTAPTAQYCVQIAGLPGAYRTKTALGIATIQWSDYAAGFDLWLVEPMVRLGVARVAGVHAAAARAVELAARVCVCGAPTYGRTECDRCTNHTEAAVKRREDR